MSNLHHLSNIIYQRRIPHYDEVLWVRKYMALLHRTQSSTYKIYVWFWLAKKKNEKGNVSNTIRKYMVVIYVLLYIRIYDDIWRVRRYRRKNKIGHFSSFSVKSANKNMFSSSKIYFWCFSRKKKLHTFLNVRENVHYLYGFRC